MLAITPFKVIQGHRDVGSRATADLTETRCRDAAAEKDRTRHCGHVKLSARLKPLVHVQGGRTGRRQPAYRVPVCERPLTMPAVSISEVALD